METRKLVCLGLIPFFLVLIAILATLNVTTVYEPPFLLLLMNTVFIGIISIVIASITSRVYTKSGSVSIILIGSGLLIFGLGSIVTGWFLPVTGGPNIAVTIYNTCACVSSVFILTGAVISTYGPMLWRGVGSIWKVTVAYSGILVFVALFSLAVMQGLVPLFFIQGVGPTVLRQVILENTVVFLAIASVLVMFTYLKGRSDFFFWYSVSLALISIGLLAVLIPSSVGSLVGWGGRSAQYLGFVFALYAVLITRRAAIAKGFPLEEALANFFIDAEQSYKMLVETATDAIITFDKDYRVLLWNAAAERMFGYSRDEAVGWPFPKLAVDDRYIAALQDYDEDIQNGSTDSHIPKPVEITCKRKDGTLFPAELTISRRRQTGGLNSTGIVRDITDRKQAEEVLRQSEERYRKLAESTNDIIFIHDKEGTFRYMNPTGARLIDIPAEELIGKNIADVFPESIASRQQGQVSEVFATAQPVFAELEIPIRGELHWFEIHLVPLMAANGTVTAAMGTVRDVTERKRVEDALALANKKIKLLYSITRHDIKNQLLALSGYLEISKRSVGDQTLISEFIVKEEKIADTIAHQISFTKDYEDMGVKAPIWQNINAVIRKVIVRLPMRNIRVDTEDPDLEVLADPLLEKVFYNLADNALQYGGEQMTSIRVTSREDDGNFVIALEDDGNGISTEDKKQLFTIGFGKHTGLGLYLSREILSITGITITENGEPGKGARFEITVPKGGYRFGQR
jgi:PAS domain S-box-containing protein